MIDFVIFSFGCKVNQVEGQSLAETLSKRGFSVSFELIPAKFYILNTCSVTAEADRKSRQAVARVLKLNGGAKVFVLGCSSQFDAEAFKEKSNVYFVGGTAGKQDAVKEIFSLIDNPSNPLAYLMRDLPREFEPMEKPITNRARTYIKVQDGCNQFCSYCIVPYLRGRSRSRELSDIVSEATQLAAESKEIVLTGINLSDYRIEGEPSLVKLIKAFGQIPVRKRLGSLGVGVISDDLLSAMRDAGFCDHIHLSVQSGSDTVLRRMNRKYSSREILSKIEKIRKYFPNCGIMSDIICGFPGETEDEFTETIQTVRSAKFSDIHIFPYSERKGTMAAEMGQVDKSVRKIRARQLSIVAQELKEEFLKSQIGTVLSVYTESAGAGYSENYCKVYSNANEGGISQILIERLYQDGLSGKSKKRADA